MRKTLLIAAATLAATVISSQAAVYSQNIVGYANLATPLAGKDYLVTCPFTVGASNGINEIFGNTLPGNSQVLTWSVTNANFTINLYDSSDPDGMGPGAPVWYEGDDSTPVSPLPCLTPGLGFFVVPAGTVTNIFAGAVSVLVGTSTNIVLPQAGKDYLVGSFVPYAGDVMSGTSTNGGPNLNNLPGNSQLLIWSTATSSYTLALYDPSDPNGDGPGAPLWYYGDDSTPYVDPTTGSNDPSIAVGQGFFIVPAGSYTWTQGL